MTNEVKARLIETMRDSCVARLSEVKKTLGLKGNLMRIAAELQEDLKDDDQFAVMQQGRTWVLKYQRPVEAEPTTESESSKAEAIAAITAKLDAILANSTESIGTVKVAQSSEIMKDPELLKALKLGKDVTVFDVANAIKYLELPFQTFFRERSHSFLFHRNIEPFEAIRDYVRTLKPEVTYKTMQLIKMFKELFVDFQVYNALERLESHSVISRVGNSLTKGFCVMPEPAKVAPCAVKKTELSVSTPVETEPTTEAAAPEQSNESEPSKAEAITAKLDAILANSTETIGTIKVARVSEILKDPELLKALKLDENATVFDLPNALSHHDNMRFRMFYRRSSRSFLFYRDIVSFEAVSDYIRTLKPEGIYETMQLVETFKELFADFQIYQALGHLEGYGFVSRVDGGLTKSFRVMPRLLQTVTCAVKKTELSVSTPVETEPTTEAIFCAPKKPAPDFETLKEAVANEIASTCVTLTLETLQNELPYSASETDLWAAVDALIADGLAVKFNGTTNGGPDNRIFIDRAVNSDDLQVMVEKALCVAAYRHRHSKTFEGVTPMQVCDSQNNCFGYYRYHLNAIEIALATNPNIVKLGDGLYNLKQEVTASSVETEPTTEAEAEAPEQPTETELSKAEAIVAITAKLDAILANSTESIAYVKIAEVSEIGKDPELIKAFELDKNATVDDIAQALMHKPNLPFSTGYGTYARMFYRKFDVDEVISRYVRTLETDCYYTLLDVHSKLKGLITPLFVFQTLKRLESEGFIESVEGLNKRRYTFRLKPKPLQVATCAVKRRKREMVVELPCEKPKAIRVSSTLKLYILNAIRAAPNISTVSLYYTVKANMADRNANTNNFYMRFHKALEVLKADEQICSTGVGVYQRWSLIDLD